MQNLGISILFKGRNILRLLGGLWITVKISLLSVAVSIVLGILLGILMTRKNPVTKVLTRIYLEFIRIMKTGSLSYNAVSGVLPADISDPQTILIYVSVILMIAGFAIKTGVVPFHSWLPDAHQSADTSISVLLSGIVIKIAGVYGFIVLTGLFKGVRAIQISLAVLGMTSIVVGALLALRQDHFKRIVAYSSVSQMGYILLGLSTGSVLGLIGAVAHVFSHAAFKSTLFTNAAALHEQTGTLEINEMGGLQSRMFQKRERKGGRLCQYT